MNWIALTAMIVCLLAFPICLISITVLARGVSIIGRMIQRKEASNDRATRMEQIKNLI
jgi:hypothetical protein